MTSLLDPCRHIVSAESLTTPPRPLRELLEDFIYAGKVHILAGDGGVGKTIFLSGLALHRAIGIDYLGLKTSLGSTAIVSAEDSRDDYMNALRVWTAVDPRLAQAEGRIVIVDLTQIATFVPEGKPIELPTLVEMRGRRYRINTAFIDAIAETITESRWPGDDFFCPKVRPDLVIFETTSRTGADESNEGASATIAAYEWLSTKTGSAIVATHHLSKASARDRANDAHALRGASAFSNNGRGTIYLTKPDRHMLAKFLDREPSRDEVEKTAYTVLSKRKSNRSAPCADVFLRLTPYRGPQDVKSVGATFVLPDRPDASAAASVLSDAREARREAGEKLQACVEGLGQAGITATLSAIREAPGRPVPYKAVADALADAVADGFLVVVPATGTRGGAKVAYRSSRQPGQPGQTGAPDNAQSAPLAPVLTRAPGQSSICPGSAAPVNTAHTETTK